MPRPSASLPEGAAPPIVLRPEGLPVKDRGGGIVTTPLVTAGRGSRAMLTGITTIAPGAAVPLHTHNCEECVIVLSGEGFAHIDGADHPVRPGYTSWIPAGVPHCFRNPSAEQPLSIFWTYASIDATRTIVATGVTTRIDEER
ncbi:cupin domain-containing protein [Sphingomonas sp. MG17]|uniref:Cupin domain-containing protein n=1 Tax=Sphingomonas tagetis TaxID=2949092 RepID=A0A9X2KJY9_9SPHN|nr:cupin domain-containing protein [Sphingomonas tagetis]MCP3729969.1 cupin domain-containing protein [Sphingomonas tagetis]